MVLHQRPRPSAMDGRNPSTGNHNHCRTLQGSRRKAAPRPTLSPATMVAIASRGSAARGQIVAVPVRGETTNGIRTIVENSPCTSTPPGGNENRDDLESGN